MNSFHSFVADLKNVKNWKPERRFWRQQGINFPGMEICHNGGPG
jgi:hypothetical protein